jgi:hypothetical protein
MHQLLRLRIPFVLNRLPNGCFILHLTSNAFRASWTLSLIVWQNFVAGSARPGYCRRPFVRSHNPVSHMHPADPGMVWERSGPNNGGRCD